MTSADDAYTYITRKEATYLYDFFFAYGMASGGVSPDLRPLLERIRLSLKAEHDQRKQEPMSNNRGFKRPPMLDRAYFDRFHAMSKATWADLYADLYRQTRGEDCSDGEVMDDAERRAEILGLRKGK